MATPLETIKNWFKTNLYPSQSQFWATWDSFWHKDESIPIDSITDLQTALDGKLDVEAYNGSAPPLQFPPYANEAAMVAAQDNQTAGYLQKVLDGPGDLGVTYYLFKGVFHETVEDYDQLTESEAAGLEDRFKYQTKRIKAKESSFTGAIELGSEYLALIETDGNISAIIWDEAYSNLLAKAAALKTAGETVRFSFTNVSQNKQVVAEVDSFGTYETSGKVISTLKTTGNFAVPTADLSVEDLLHVFLPVVGSGGEGGEGGGADGDDGADGKSAYQSYLDTTTDDPVFTEVDWIASLKGEKGDTGDKGDDGEVGKSAYQSALDSGFIGTEAEWIASYTKDKVQLALTATGTLTVDFSGDIKIADIVLTGDTVIGVTPPTLAIGESITTFMYIEPDGNVPSVTTTITDNMEGGFDDLTLRYRIVTTWIRRDGSTLVNTSTNTPQV
jgi:hypothetical protein